MRTNELFNLLKNEIKGEVKRDSAVRASYSRDDSLFEVEPLVVVLPKTKGDVIKVVEVASGYSIPIIPRGAGTGTTGGCLGKGVVIDFSKYLDAIHFDGKTVRCEPGVVLEDLNRFLSFYGLRLGPDTSSSNRATIGGLVANNAAGPRSLRFGAMADHLVSCETILSDATVATFGPIAEGELREKCLRKDLEGSIYRRVLQIREEEREEITKRFPKIPRRVSGYSLDVLYQTPFNLGKLLAGSEGTLGLFTEIELGVVKMLPDTFLSLYFFNSMREAFAFIPSLLKEPLISLEMIDEEILKAAKDSFLAKHHLQWIREGAKCVLFAETEHEPLNKQCFVSEKQEKESIFLVRKKGLELLLSKRGYAKAAGFLEDISYPPEKSLEFYDKFLTLFKDFKEIGLYGHVGVGCLHLRPFIDLRNRPSRKEMLTLMEKGADILVDLGGSLSGEHGDGMVRSWLNERLYGKRIYQAFKALKKAFDPKGILNPQKIVSKEFPEEALHPSAKGEVNTFLNFSQEGGLALSAELCNGNGFCRKKEGLMCPSFQATRDEFDTTRARAELLRQAIHEGGSGLRSKDLKKVLDLCLECKGCKVECPSSVDMAKMKAEVLYHQPKSLRDFFFAHLPFFWSLGSNWPNWINTLQTFKWTKSLLSLSTTKPLPRLALHKFSTQFQPETRGQPLVLFNDTYTEFSAPHIGKSATELLQRLGFSPILPPWSCCGRPLFSKGFLKRAKKRIESLVQLLYPLAKEHPILVLEPSCYSMLKEDLFSLLGPNHSEAQLVSKKVVLIDEFLYHHLHRESVHSSEESILIHTHCHQKASPQALSTKKLLDKIGSWNVKEIPSGCCGMAGAFGYEKEHEAISDKILNLSLQPTLQQSRYTTLIVNGFSCRSQVASKNPEHVVEFLSRQKLP